MKTPVRIFLLSLLFAMRLGAQVAMIHPISFSVQNPMTPLVIMEHFARNYPEATPFWSMEGKDYTVMFIDPITALRHIILYDKHGTILRSEDELDSSSCPETILHYYSRNFPNQTFDIWSYEDIKQGKKYYLKHRSREIWFDENGNYVSKKRGLFIN